MSVGMVFTEYHFTLKGFTENADFFGVNPFSFSKKN
jgi:hypothetical protein